MTAAGASQHWDEWQARREAAPQRFVDWADHPTVMALLQQELFGDAAKTVLHYLRSEYPQFAQARAISLCCGDGAFERLLVESGVFGSVVGTDLSPVRVQHANEQRGALASRLEFRVSDANSGDFGEAEYDVVFAKAALHHVENLEAMFEGAVRCLRAGGRLVTIDFFGPTRFQWTDEQLAAANRLLDEMPAELRTQRDGSLYRVERPTVAAMIELDPSEAVRSAELYRELRRHFTIEREFAAGGSLLNLVLGGPIVDNFDPANPAHNEWIRKAFLRERDLMARGVIGSDFRFIVARPRPMIGA